MKDGSPEQAMHFMQQRLAALELILEHVLPMLIQGAPHQQDIRKTLQEWDDDAPLQMQGNDAFALFVQGLLNDLPND